MKHQAPFKEKKKEEDMNSYTEYTDQPEKFHTSKVERNKRKSKEKEPKPALTLNCALDFGKFKGKTVKNLILHHPSYITWMKDKEVREFNEEALKYIRTYL